MTTYNRNAPIIQAVDKETIRTLASLPFEKQTFVKGIILGLSNQGVPTPPTGSAAPAAVQPSV